MVKKPFCTLCGSLAEKGDIFCRKCGGKIARDPEGKTKEQTEVGEIKKTLSELSGLIEKATEHMKKELIEQVKEIEKGLGSGKLTKTQFDAEVEEIRNRLNRFINKR